MSKIVYLDVCCLKRPFDDQRAARIQLETSAIATLIDLAERAEIRLARSPAHLIENARNPREDRRLAAALWLGTAGVVVPASEVAAARARWLATLGFGTLDALHVAFAEAAAARWLITTDDRLVALGRRHRGLLQVDVAGPVAVIEALSGGVA